jgi:predicted TIM-barrel fold metal-dependent hydrolase
MAAPYTWDQAWLDRDPEAVIDPELPIIDPHHHLWDAPTLQRYVLEDLRADTGAGHNVEGTVFIDCMWDYRRDGPRQLRQLGETERAAAEARRSQETPGAQIKGIVSWVDMTLGPAAGPVLDAHLDAGDGLFRGIRHATAFDDDPHVSASHTKPTAGMMADDAFRAGGHELAARGLSFDAWLYHPQLPEVIAFARAVPELTIVLDHLGGPLGIGRYAGHRDEIMARWRIDMAEVATCPNVNVKLGGIGMVTYGLGFESHPAPPSSDDLVAAWGGPITYAIERFGADRCMFESNFPVDKESCSYVTLWNAFKKIAGGASDDERAALFHDTATRVYRLT